MARHRRHFSGHSVTLLLLLATIAGGIFGFSPLVPASASPPKGSSGSVTFSGQLSGTLKVPAFLPPGHIIAGCEISTQAGTDIVQWPTAKIKVRGKTKTIHNVDLQVDVNKFDQTYAMTVNHAGASLGSVSFSYGTSVWRTRSGTIKTTAAGKSGSFHGKLSAGTSTSTTATIKGSWSGCVSVLG